MPFVSLDGIFSGLVQILEVLPSKRTTTTTIWHARPFTSTFQRPAHGHREK